MQDRPTQRPSGVALDHTGLGDDLLHRSEDAYRVAETNNRCRR